ncbi:MAG: CHC2 zinc finger domain-containing protein, partial [Fibrobacteraceae bacterium]
IEDEKSGLSKIETNPKRLGVPLTRWGRNLLSQCPFHSPEESSLFFYDSLGYWRYHCLQCGSDGDLVEFLIRSRFNGLSEKDARKEALNFWGSSEEKIAQDKNNGDSHILKEIGGEKARVLESFVRYCHWAACKSESTAGYLKSRGWNLGQAQLYGIGYYSGDPEPFISYCLLSGLERHEVSFYLDNLELFHEPRLTIPARNSKGILHSVYGRTLDSLVTTAPDTYISYASGPMDIPFNIQQDNSNPIIVEGFFDALTADLAGIPGVVSTMYQQFTPSHLYKLKACGAESITLILRRETNRRSQEFHIRKYLELAESEGLRFKSVVLPKDEAVDTFVRKEGADALLSMIRDTEEDTMRTHRRSVLLQDIKENFDTAMLCPADSDVGYPLFSFPTLSHTIDGVQSGCYFVSSEPFGFKSDALTSFALDLIEGNDKVKVIYVALDSPRRQVFDRTIAMIADISERNVRKQNADEETAKKVRAGTQKLLDYVKKNRFEIWEDTPSFDNIKLTKYLQEELAENPNIVLIIDGIDHLRISNRNDISELTERRSSAMLDLYKALDIPIFLGGELFRNDKKIVGPRPYIRDADAIFWIGQEEDGVFRLSVTPKRAHAMLYEANIELSKNSNRMREQ